MIKSHVSYRLVIIFSIRHFPYHLVERDENLVNYNIIHIRHSTKSIFDYCSSSTKKNSGDLIFLQIICLNIVVRVCRG